MRLFVRVIVVVLLGVSPAGAAPQSAPPAAPQAEADAAYYFLLGRHLENQNKIEEAIAAHRKAIALMPDSAELRAELAALYARQDRAEEALEASEAALARDPDNREANRILGSIYAALSEQRQAVRPGDNPRTYRSKAIEALEKARQDVFDVNVELMLGRLYVQAGEHDKAIAPLRRVVDDQPGYPEAAMLLASAYSESGRDADAVRVLETTIADNPGFYRGRVRLAELYEEQRRFKEAAALYEQAQAINPRADLLGARATALINGGSPHEARKMLESAMAARGKPDAALLYLLAQAQRRAGDSRAAAETAKQLGTAFPGDLRGVLLQAQVAEEEGRLTDAIDGFKTLTEKVPDDPTFVYQYANLLDRAGRTGDAERALRDLLARDPLDANAMNSLGYMFAERGERLDEAVDLLQRALKIEPANPSFLDSLGWAYFKQGDVALAEAPIVKAAEALPESSAVQDHLGDLRFRQQRFADAAAAWERALAGDGEDVDRAAIEKKLQDARQRLRK
jgi:tetratricopeptide (TPR) repeat protein